MKPITLKTTIYTHLTRCRLHIIPENYISDADKFVSGELA